MKWKGGGGPFAPFISFSIAWTQEHYVKFTHILQRFTQMYTILYISMCRQRERMKWNGVGGRSMRPLHFIFSFLSSRTYMWNSYIFTFFMQIDTIFRISMRRQEARTKWNGRGGEVHVPPLFHFQFPTSGTLCETSHIYVFHTNLYNFVHIYA